MLTPDHPAVLALDRVERALYVGATPPAALRRGALRELTQAISADPAADSPQLQTVRDALTDPSVTDAVSVRLAQARLEPVTCRLADYFAATCRRTRVAT